MEKEFVPYEESKLLQEIDFDEETIGDYIKKDKHDDRLPAPLYQQAFRWFRENHGLYTNVTRYNDDDEDKFLYYIDNGDIKEEFKTYEEAELACLRKLIEIVKTK